MKWLSVFLVLAAAQPVFAVTSAELTPAQTEFFENKIRPILVDNCYKCHSAQAQKIRGGLLLDTRQGLLDGGDSGPAIVPGDPDNSLLIQAVRYTNEDLQMPKDKKLPDELIADLTTWVKMGAPDPRVEIASAGTNTWTDNKTNHWAWQPLKQEAIPDVSDPSWCQTPVDNFVLAQLDEKGLKPNPPADRRTLIRRATFDLIGLPPTPQEVDDFVNDPSTNAFAKVVDRLLASPRYGERWARHWLDVARYSDTKGQPRRDLEDNLNPFAWTYRDYVIRSFNEDKPYNQFILEQLAADRLPSTRSHPENLTALGFLTVGDHFMGRQNDIINDRIDVVCKGFLGLTVTCARCHDHKFDPIPQKDYYSMYGIFDSCVEPKVEPVIGKITRNAAYEAYYQAREKMGQDEIQLRDQLQQARKDRDREAIKMDQRKLQDTIHAIAELEYTNLAAPERAMVLEDTVKGHNSPLLIRGEAGNRGEIVPRHYLQVLSGPYRPAFTNGSGRLQFALDTVNPRNPLTPRVMINRIWLHHFGAGFVTTPDDFGMMSEPPSNPGLLDYLANNFITNGWSIKKIHRLIMLSSTYQESSDDNPRYAQTDPDNRYCWRANIRRLEYEPLRDSLLAIGGMLDTNMYGRPIDLRIHPDSGRRAIYDFVDRSSIPDTLINFDFPPPDMPSGIRHQTMVPQQALFMMNSPLVIELARRLVAMPEFIALDDDESRLKFLYERLYQRLPTDEEIQLGEEFVDQTPIHDNSDAEPAVGKPQQHPGNARPQNGLKSIQLKKQPPGRRFGPKRVPLTSWEEYAQALLQANEFCFVN